MVSGKEEWLIVVADLGVRIVFKVGLVGSNAELLSAVVASISVSILLYLFLTLVIAVGKVFVEPKILNR